MVGLRSTWTEALVEQQRVSRDSDCQDKEDREGLPGRRGSAASRLAQETKGATARPRRGAPRQIDLNAFQREKGHRCPRRAPGLRRGGSGWGPNPRSQFGTGKWKPRDLTEEPRCSGKYWFYSAHLASSERRWAVKSAFFKKSEECQGCKLRPHLRREGESSDRGHFARVEAPSASEERRPL